MASFFGVDSNSVGSLFSSLNTTNKSSDLSSLLSDYSSIRSGSYKKLLNKYYAEDSTSSSKSASSTTSTASDTTKKLASIQSNAKSLNTAASDLVSVGTKSLFNKVSKTAEDGTTSKEYDTDAIYKAVKSFVDSYNGVIDSTETTNTSSIANSVKNMITNTKANQNLLKSVGITVDSDFNLSIDEKAFKKADMSVVKSLFNGSGSYGYQVSAKAAMINSNAASEASKANTYGNNGKYNYNYNAGDIYNSLF